MSITILKTQGASHSFNIDLKKTGSFPKCPSDTSVSHNIHKHN